MNLSIYLSQIGETFVLREVGAELLWSHDGVS